MNHKLLLGLSLTAAFIFTGCDDDDTTKPEFYITDVKDGVVNGTISDHTSSFIKINSIQANANDPSSGSKSLRNHSFSLTGLNMDSDLFNIYAEDTSSKNNRSDTLTLANRNKTVDDAITMKINESGIGFMSEELAMIIKDMDIKTLLGGEDPTEPFYIYEDIPETKFYASTEESEYVIDKPTIIMTPLESTDGKMKMSIHATFPKIIVGVDAEPTAAYLPNLHVVPETDAILTGSVILSQNDGKTIVASTENIDVVMGEVTGLTGFDWIDGIIANQFKDQLQTFFEGALEGNISSILTETFANIPFENNDIPVNGKIVNFSALPTLLASDSSSLGLMMKSHAKAPMIDSSLKGALGSLYIDQPLSIANNDTEFDISTVVSANLLNQMLLAAYQSGATTISGTASGYDYTAISQAPAYVELDQNGDDIGTFIVKRMRVDIEDENSNTTTATIDLSLKLSQDTIGVDNGNLVFNLDQVIPDVKVLTFNNKGGFTRDLVQIAVDLLVPTLMPELTSSLNNLPLPNLVGYSVNLRKTASTNNHLLLAGNMVSVATTAAAPAPDTFAMVASNMLQSNGATGNSISAEGPVTLSLSGDNPTEEPLQYRYQIDGGNWSVWTDNTEATINNATPGAHTALVCARTYEMKVDPTCAEVSFIK